MSTIDAYKAATEFVDKIAADKFVGPAEIEQARTALLALFTARTDHAVIQGAFIGAALTAFGMGLIALIGRYGP